jgi:hypothetical protein
LDPLDPPSDEYMRLRWIQDTLKDVERHATPIGTFRESRSLQRFSIYVVVMSKIIDSGHSSFEEAIGQHVWKDSMMEEYQSIKKNDVWDIVVRPKGKFVVTSKWIYKIYHIVDGSIDK